MFSIVTYRVILLCCRISNSTRSQSWTEKTTMIGWNGGLGYTESDMQGHADKIEDTVSNLPAFCSFLENAVI